MNSMTTTETPTVPTIFVHAYRPAHRAELGAGGWSLQLPPLTMSAKFVRHLYRDLRRDGLDQVDARAAVINAANAFSFVQRVD